MATTCSHLCSAGHKTCSSIYTEIIKITNVKFHNFDPSKLKFGVAIVPMTRYYGDEKEQSAILGLECGRIHKTTHNLCTSSMKPNDGGCFLKAAWRELTEEFKIILNGWKDFDSIFRIKDGQYKWVLF